MKRRQTGDVGDDGEDNEYLDEGHKEAEEIFGEEDVAHTDGGEEIELRTGGFEAEGVVAEWGDGEERVAHGGWEDPAGSAVRGEAARKKEHEENGH